MGSARRRSTLGEHIAAALNKSRGRDSLGNSVIATTTRTLACTSVALFAMHSAQVGAVGLGEIKMQSGVGQPLRATVPITIGANESIKANCVRTTDTRQSALGTPTDAAVTVPAVSRPGTYSLRIGTANPLYEPMYELALLVDCPGTTILVRHYVLMLDLPGMATQAPAAAVNSPVAAAPPQPAPEAMPASVDAVTDAPQASVTRLRAAPRRLHDPIPAATEYRVQEGDTLSTIAARIEGRPRNATWDVAMQIFARNPEAFIRANPDLIKLGQVIRIPTVAAMELSAGVSVSNNAPRIPKLPEPAPLARPSIDAMTREDAMAEMARIESYTRAERDIAAGNTSQPVGKRSPFADEAAAQSAVEQTGSERVAPAAISTTESKAPTIEAVITVADERPRSEEINPFIAIILGILLGLALSLLIVRGHLLEFFAGLVKRDAPAARNIPASVEVDTFNEFDASASDFQGPSTTDFDDSVAEAAFDTGPSIDPDATPVQFGTPLEETYIVEVSEAEQTASEQSADDGLFAPTTGMSTDDSLAGIDSENIDLLIELDNTPNAQAGVPDDTVLSKLFDEDFDPAAVDNLDRADKLSAENLDPTAEMPASNIDPTAKLQAQNLEPTAELPAQNLEPTAELPASFVDPMQTNEATAELPANFVDPAEVIDPTAEMPGSFVDTAEVIDPTAEMPADERAAHMSMTQSFSENLERLDAGTADSAAGTDTDGDNPVSVDSTTKAVQVPGSGGKGSVTSEINLEELVKGASEDESLSQTLHEALTLLERDYEDEFTASQILERKEIEKALEEDDEETIATRKINR